MEPLTNKQKKHMSRVQNLGCIACARLGKHDKPAELYHVKRNSPLAVIPLCYFHLHGPLGIHRSRPADFAYSHGTPQKLLNQVMDWLNYEDKKTDQIDPANPFTRNNIFIYE